MRMNSTSMKCNGCGTSMLLEKTESSGKARTAWHQCPLCGKVRLKSEPEFTHRELLEDSVDDSAYAVGPTYAGQLSRLPA